MRHRPKDPWKYIEPKDITKPVVIDGKEWYYCTKCKCRATGRTGFYQLSHTDATHDPNWRPEGNSSPIQDPDPTPAPPIRPPIPTPSSLEDDLVFTGVNCAPVILDNVPRDERERPEGALRTVETIRHLENVNGFDGGSRTHVIDVSNTKVPSDDFLNENSNSVNYFLCQLCTTVCSTSTTTTKNKNNEMLTWRNSTMYRFFLSHYELGLTMLWSLTTTLLYVVGTFLSMTCEYYHLQLKVWALVLTSSF